MERYDLPEGWEWKRLGDICEIVSGSTPRTDNPRFWNGDILWATPKDLSSLSSVEIHDTARKITREGYESCSTRLLPIGAVLLSSRAPIGLLAIAAKPMCTNQGFKSFICSNQIYNRYLYYVLKNFTLHLQFKGRGGTFTEIPKRLVAEFEIPLPPLAEQRGIVARIEEISRRVREASRLQAEACHATSTLLPAALSMAVNSIARKRKPLAEILSVKPRNGWSPKCDDSPNGTPVLTLSAVTGFQYDGSKIKRTSAKTNKQAHYWLEPGDLLITRSNTLDLVGHAAIYDGTPYPCIYSDLMMRTRVDPRHADPRFVHLWLMGNEARGHIKTRAQGTSASMKKIGQRDVLEIPFPDIDFREQRRIVAYLDSIRAKAEELKRQQEAMEAELDKVIPSVLSKAFRGEL